MALIRCSSSFIEVNRTSTFRWSNCNRHPIGIELVVYSVDIFVLRDSPAFPIKFEQDGIDLLTKLAPVHKPTRSPYKLFYQVLGIPVTELEHKKQFKLLFYSPEDQGTF